MEKFKKGVQYVNIVSAVTKKELTSFNGSNNKLAGLSKVKFIPASGAATRMFKDLYAYLENRENTEFVEHFFKHLESFAFYDTLSKHIDFDQVDKEKVQDRIQIINVLLNDEMDYGRKPKALLEFHQYVDRTTTPIDEHIFEGEHYLDTNKVNLHFTISVEDEERFNEYVKKAITGKEHVHISYSLQKEKTKTVAANMHNEPFTRENGEVLYRPGGHGALLENLNDLEEDIIFIKNIDNVSHQSQAKEDMKLKNQLAGIGLEVKLKIDQYIQDILSNEYDLNEVTTFIQETLNITFKGDMTSKTALKFLNRPLRVCGMVKNEGEPGGGPYIVDNGDYLDLQICEASEIDMNDEKQINILNTSEYFNPVDLVCFTKDYKGDKFNLMDYMNDDRYFISEKSYNGQPLKALEHPGLWNGAMHNWNTLFVEVPLSSFNPVKNVNDLLKKGHQAVLERV